MSDKTRIGRGVDDRDVQARSTNRTYRVASTQRAPSSDTDRLGREQQRRATAYARAKGQL